MRVNSYVCVKSILDLMQNVSCLWLSDEGRVEGTAKRLIGRPDNEDSLGHLRMEILCHFSKP